MSLSSYESLMFADLPLTTKLADDNPVQIQRSFSRSMFQAISVESMRKHYDVSSAFNLSDMIAVNFLIQAVIADSKGFMLLSYAELEERKRELDIDRSRLLDLQHKLKVERKMKEAALSLSKYHIPPVLEVPGSRAKRLSKHAFDEADLSFEKLAVLQAEYDELSQRVHAREIEILRSSVATLGLTHPGSNSSVAADYLKLEQAATVQRESERSPIVTGQPLPSHSDVSKNTTAASSIAGDENPRDVVPNLSRGLSKRSVASLGVKPGLSRGLSIRSNLVSETYEDEKLESLILTVSSVLPARDSPGPLPSTRKKLEHLEEITRVLVREYVTKEDECSAVGDAEQQQQQMSARNLEIESLRQQVDALKAELAASRTAENEWRERTSEVKAELERVLSSLEVMTKQSANYEAERGRMEVKISELERELMSSSKMSTLDNSSVSTASGSGSVAGDVPLSVVILRNDFKKMVDELNEKHMEIILKEQSERRRLEELLGGGAVGTNNNGSNHAVNVM